ncbi:hypothetical protein MP638_000904 [Amoeboaphelidium occidentale]|nr:hypothetical protein MP638_000904 [Amoeboaphelidium occidentale]
MDVLRLTTNLRKNNNQRKPGNLTVDTSAVSKVDGISMSPLSPSSTISPSSDRSSVSPRSSQSSGSSLTSLSSIESRTSSNIVSVNEGLMNPLQSPLFEDFHILRDIIGLFKQP